MKPNPKTMKAISCGLLAVALATGAADAQQLPDDLINAEILGGWRTETGTQMAALHLTLAEGWKTYWRAPGDAGIPPQFDWTGSTNITGVTYHWPRPSVFVLSGLRSIGYKNDLLLPIEFQPATPGDPVSVTASITLGVCQDVCVPITVDVSADLSSATKVDPAIRAALDQAPRSARAAGISQPRCTVAPISDGLRLTTTIALPAAVDGDFVVVELSDSSVWVSSVETTAADGALVEVSDLVPSMAKPFSLDRSSLRYTIFTAKGDVIDVQGCAG